MKELDPGHEYLLDSIEGEANIKLTFVKREGPGYPKNIGNHPGTNCQEVLRALISRLTYLQSQIFDERNDKIIELLRNSIYLLEERAAERHGRSLNFSVDLIETYTTCPHCGHIGCEISKHKEKTIEI